LGIIGFTRRFFREQRLRFSLATIALFVVSLTEGAAIALLLPLLRMMTDSGSQTASGGGRIGNVVKIVLDFVGAPFTLVSVLVFIFIIILLQQGMMLAQQKLILSTQFRFEISLRERVYRAVFNAKWPFFVQTKLGHITDVLSTEVTRCGQAVQVLNLLISGTLVSIVYLAVAVSLSWQATLVIFLGGLSVMLLSQRRTGKGKFYGAAITQANQAFQDEVTEQVSAAKLIKGYAAQNAVIARFRDYYEAVARAMYRGYFNQAKLKAFVEAGMATILLVAIYSAVTFFEIDIAGLMIILFVFYRLAPRLSNIQTSAHKLNILIQALQRVDSLEAQAKSMKESEGTLTLERFKQGILLKDVDFSYDTGHPVLRKISLEIPKGKTIAIVGMSGAGKSTIVDLIIGLVEPRNGKVLLDGHPVREYYAKSWKQKIGYVAQETVLFNDTVEANICWAHPNASKSDVTAAAKMAYAHEFIEQLPKSYDTVIGARGVKLSGGQRQRLALARAMLRRPELLILDEATSALDAVSEKKIQKAVEKLSATITVLIVTHRLATIRNADYIYVLEDGKVVEKGTWNELTKTKSIFNKQKKLQTLE